MIAILLPTPEHRRFTEAPLQADGKIAVAVSSKIVAKDE
jgi:hypothetical protein